MVPNQSKPVAARVPIDLAERLDRAADENDLTKSKLVARAVEYYVDENPDRIRAFYPDGSLAAFVEELFE
ncbi:ribbon-helix-helix protein, CopG family [Haloterrigena alkaliphila]|uniref:Ribbon-helix-helix protein, CopG family n=1 Tax=Haloterrigena alkaliphila TaxID=2816475 RepID=A0A8A2VI31_9EURY|nr:ribbon-helix-helix protein, CopG family [Haloterrigena alkaliphila]QSX01007.1 ribbon-helix-helix protein, CopG family [Haloterrigena alkaliphila]